MNTKELTPALCVVPIVGMHGDGGCGPFLGTAFFCGDRRLLVTCDHVLRGWNGSYGISAQEDTPRLYAANPILRDEETDLACLKVPDYDPPYSFPLAEASEVILNEFVCAFEYGTTDVAGGHINFSPSNRLGNVTRTRNLTDNFGKAGDRMLELSFPALKGASGAPVILGHPPFSLWGVVTANVARELLPVQVERIVDELGEIEEETKFLLPQALAINVVHVRDFLRAVEGAEEPDQVVD